MSAERRGGARRGRGERDAGYGEQQVVTKVAQGCGYRVLGAAEAGSGENGNGSVVVGIRIVRGSE